MNRHAPHRVHLARSAATARPCRRTDSLSRGARSDSTEARATSTRSTLVGAKRSGDYGPGPATRSGETTRGQAALGQEKARRLGAGWAAAGTGLPGGDGGGVREISLTRCSGARGGGGEGACAARCRRGGAVRSLRERIEITWTRSWKRRIAVNGAAATRGHRCGGGGRQRRTIVLDARSSPSPGPLVAMGGGVRENASQQPDGPAWTRGERGAQRASETAGSRVTTMKERGKGRRHGPMARGHPRNDVTAPTRGCGGGAAGRIYIRPRARAPSFLPRGPAPRWELQRRESPRITGGARRDRELPKRTIDWTRGKPIRCDRGTHTGSRPVGTEAVVGMTSTSTRPVLPVR